MLNTPIHKWNIPGVPDGFELYIKRDDMTGATLSGNKIRKLEFLFGDAIEKGCKHFITCGGIQSNYCRAVAVAAAQLGIKAHLFLRSDDKNIGCSGNVMINRLCGASMYIIPHESDYHTEILPRMQRLQQHITRETGEKCYMTEVGGSNHVGFYGYLEAFSELINQDVHSKFDDVVVTTGSGGSVEGLAGGNYLTGSKVKIHAVAICDDAEHFYLHGNTTFSQVGLPARAQDIYDVIEGYQGQGYAIATQQDLDFIPDVAASTGIILDPTYTGKAARGLLNELQTNPDRFNGKRILFIHTGGIFGTYDGRLDETVCEKNTSSDKITFWDNLDQSPFA